MKNGSFPLSQPLVAELGAVSDGVISAKWPLIPGWGSSFGVLHPSRRSRVQNIHLPSSYLEPAPISAATCVSPRLFMNTLEGGGTF